MLSAVDLVCDYQGKVDVEKCRAKWVESISIQLSHHLYVFWKITRHKTSRSWKILPYPSFVTLEWKIWKIYIIYMYMYTHAHAHAHAHTHTYIHTYFPATAASPPLWWLSGLLLCTVESLLWMQSSDFWSKQVNCFSTRHFVLQWGHIQNISIILMDIIYKNWRCFHTWHKKHVQ